MKLNISPREVFLDFLEKVSKLRESSPQINKRLKNLNLIKIQNQKQDKKISTFLRHYFEHAKIKDWDFLNEPVPDRPYSSVSSFFATHDSRNLRYLFREIEEVVVPKGLLFVVDYNMSWIRKIPLHSEREKIFNEYFNSANEKKEMSELQQKLGKAGGPICYELHTKYSLADHVKVIERAGFKTIQAESKPEENPKIFLYIGVKK